MNNLLQLSKNVCDRSHRQLTFREPFSKRFFGDFEVRIAGTPDEPWFCAKDVCKALNLTNVSKAVEPLKADQKSTITLSYSGRMTTNLLHVSESGLYRLVFKSRKAEALAFQDWVCGEVLPAIRKKGKYEVQQQSSFLEKKNAKKLTFREPLLKVLKVLRNKSSSSPTCQREKRMSVCWIGLYTLVS